MPLKEWIIPRGLFAILIRRETQGGQPFSFAVILMAYHGGEWLNVTRYDTSHGFAHRDVVGVNEALRHKISMPTLTHKQAFRHAICDLEQNAEIYLADFLAH